MSSIDDLLYAPIGGVQDASQADIIYYSYDRTGKFRFIPLSERAKQFFEDHYNYDAGDYRALTSSTIVTDWTFKPPADFVIVEWDITKPIPKDAWGRHI